MGTVMIKTPFLIEFFCLGISGYLYFRKSPKSRAMGQRGFLLDLYLFFPILYHSQVNLEFR